ncbi:hypothetical protein [Streptomyces griseus]|uniref:hypothetical protein n=1 Tax=Streptomyces griseus TaxID=1911 RepID=UPI0009A0EB9A|nr:hypothetical protein [Streptomyces griseus]
MTDSELIVDLRGQLIEIFDDFWDAVSEPCRVGADKRQEPCPPSVRAPGSGVEADPYAGHARDVTDIG